MQYFAPKGTINALKQVMRRFKVRLKMSEHSEAVGEGGEKFSSSGY